MQRVTVTTPLFVCVALAIVVTAPVRAVTVDIPAIADGAAQGTNGFTSIDTDDDLIRTSKSGGFESRGLFEFDLASIPNNATIFAATFVGRFDTLSHNGQAAELTATGFAGNGSIELADATAAGTEIGMVSLTTNSEKDFSMPILNSTPIQGVLDDAVADDFFTLRTSAVNVVNWNVFSVDSTGAARKPALRLTYLVLPEPSSGAVALLTATFAAPWFRRRRRAAG